MFLQFLQSECSLQAGDGSDDGQVPTDGCEASLHSVPLKADMQDILYAFIIVPSLHAPASFAFSLVK